MFSNPRMRLLLITGLVLSTSGCISYEHVTEHTARELTNEAFLRHVNLGETTTDWLLEQLGEPQRVITHSQDSSVWQYHHVVNEATRLKALPLFAVKLETADQHILNFEITNGLVTQMWPGTHQS